jgi:hypothetical protein
MEANFDAFLNSALAGVSSLTIYFLWKESWNVGRPFRRDEGQNNSYVTKVGGPTAGAGRSTVKPRFTNLIPKQKLFSP